MPDALFALNNNITNFSLKHLQRLGYDIPGKAMLLGFDSAIQFTFTRPTVSVIAQPIEIAAERAIFAFARQQLAPGRYQTMHEVLSVKSLKRLSSIISQTVAYG